jgi:NitT/TauT family transport system substrate-binding protein
MAYDRAKRIFNNCCKKKKPVIKQNENTTKEIVAIHEEATNFINDNIKNGTTDKVVELLPEDIVTDPAVEAESLESFPFISGIDKSFKSDVDAFQQLEVDIGLLNSTIPQDKLYWEA